MRDARQREGDGVSSTRKVSKPSRSRRTENLPKVNVEKRDTCTYMYSAKI